MKNILSMVFFGFAVFLFLFFQAWNSNGVASTIVFNDRLQIQFITEPERLVAGREALITIKLFGDQNFVPVTDGKLHATIRSVPGQHDPYAKTNIISFQDQVRGDQFGNYSFLFTFPEPGAYSLQADISGIVTTGTVAPFTSLFLLGVSPHAGAPMRGWYVLSIALLITLAAIYAFHLQRKPCSNDPAGFNLLNISWLRKIITWPYSQPFIQIPLVFTLLFILLLSFYDIQDGGRNIATKLIWTIWWAGVIFTFVLVGRLWCYMCPVGALSEWSSRFFKSKKKFPAIIRNVWLANLFFLILTWLDLALGIVGNPALTGTIFLATTIFAVAVSIVYERRTFCRYLCPIGGIIGIYSLFSPLELRSKDLKVCREHKHKDCFIGNNKGRGCPMYETIPEMDNNSACNFCGACIRSCPKDNISLRLRPFFKDAWTTSKWSLDEAVLAIVLVGVSIFVTGDMLEPWEGWLRIAVGYVPTDLLGIDYYYTAELVAKTFLFITFAVVLIPAMMVAASWLSGRFSGPAARDGVLKTFTVFGYMFIPVGLSMHLAHNLGHLLNEAGGIVPVFQRVINKYTPYFTGEPDWNLAATPLVSAPVLFWTQMTLLLVFHCFSLYAGYKIAGRVYGDREIAFRAFFPFAILSFLFMALNILLLNLPMALRHVH